MTLYEFRMLEEDAQWDAVWILGQFVDIHFTSESKYVLYAIDRFFVEVKWVLKTDEIIGKGAFIEGDSLDKYSSLEELE